MDAEAATEGGVLTPIEDGAVAPPADALAIDPGRSIAARVVRLAWPVLVEQALLYLVGLSDTILTGRYLLEEHLAAVTVSTYLLWFLGSLPAIVSVGATALVARLTGSGDRAEANRICQQAVGIALILGLATALGGELVAPGLVRALNLEGGAAAAATMFLRTILLATPLLAATAAGVACLRGVGDTRTGMWVMIGVNLVNAALAWTLVRGLGPIPSLGFRGIAIGTTVGEAVGGLAVLAILGRGRSGLKLSWLGMKPGRRRAWRIARISLPSAGESLTNTFCQLWFFGLINRLGATATAAHGVAIRCEALAFLTVAAFSVAASTLTGQYLGAGRPDLAARAARVAWAIAVAVLSAVGVLLYFEGAAMFGLFLGGKQPGVTAEGVPVLRIVAFALPFLATLAVLNGALRGAGDTRWPWAFVLIGYLGVRMPLTYWLTYPEGSGGLGLGLRGAWLAMLADLAIRGVLVAARFLQGGWKRLEV